MTDSVRGYIDRGVLIVLGVLAVSLGALFSSEDVSGLSYLDDNCYSTPSVLSTMGQNVGGLFGDDNLIGRFGMVNAIVRVPIYDWDQSPPPAGTSDSHTISGKAPLIQPLGYLEYFSASVTPIPNIQWVQRYAQDQAPYDLSRIGMLFGAGGGVREPNPFIANPLLYQRSSIINPDGKPNITFTNSDYEARPEGYRDSEEGGLSQGNFEDLQNFYDYDDAEMLNNEVGRDTIDSIRRNPGQYNKNTASTGFNFSATPFSVNKANPGDNCHEYLSNDSPMVPSYAFSVVGMSRPPITYPGTFITPITYLAGYGVSASGVTTYPSSMNGKMMLDCYGRGSQPTITARNQTIGQFSMTTGWTGIVERPKAIWEMELWEWAVVRAAQLIDLSVGMGNVIQSMPMPKIVKEEYFNGMAYLFKVDTPQQSDLPVQFRSREIDHEASELSSINWNVLTDTSNKGHANSNNGTTYYPNLFIKLKKPYKHVPVIAANPEDKEQDGTMIKLNPKIQKLGFTESGKYNDTGHNNHKPIVAGARIVEVILEPGQSGREIRDNEFVGADLGTTNGMDPNQLCSFMREKLGDPTAECDASRPEFGGGTGINVAGLPGVEKSNSTNAFNLIGSSGGVLSRKIPAETKPGTKFCYAVYLSHRDNDFKYSDERYYNTADNYNGSYSAIRDKRFLSKTYCVISGYKPSFQVRGGDLIVSGAVETEVNRKEYLANDATYRTYGSWVEYGAMAGGPIRNLASGAQYRVGMPSGPNPNPTPAMSTEALSNAPTAANRGQLTFSNNSNTAGGGVVVPDYGNFGPTSDGISNIVTQFIELKPTATIIPDTRVDVASLDDGVYIVGGGGSVSLGRDLAARVGPPAKIGESKSVIILVRDGTTVYIDENIELQDEYSSEGALSQVVITPDSQSSKFTINVTPDVSRVDSWIINPSGVLNTCYIDNPDVSEQVPRGFDWPCYNTLTVNGPVSVKTLLLRRAGSQDQNDTAPFKLHQSQAGENFNLRPDAYIWAENYVSDFGRKFITTNILDLPPRF